MLRLGGDGLAAVVVGGTAGIRRVLTHIQKLMATKRPNNIIKKTSPKGKLSASFAAFQAATQASLAVDPTGEASKQHMQSFELHAAPLLRAPLSCTAALAVVSCISSNSKVVKQLSSFNKVNRSFA